MSQRFIAMLDEIGLTISPKQITQFKTYFRELIEWNSKLNLTSITDEEEVEIKHFYDSLCLIRAFDPTNQTILDVGSGAGFPSIPLKIMFPDLQITIIDAIQKRINFLQHLVDLLGVDITLIHGRVEEYNQRDSFDIVTARAVANLRILSELCIPFVKVGGQFLAMKGPNFEEEIEESLHAVDILQATLEQVITYKIDMYERSIVSVRKQHPSPQKYPRRFKKIKSKPL